MGTDCISSLSLLIFLSFKFLVSKIFLHECQELKWFKTQRFYFILFYIFFFFFVWLEILLIANIFNLIKKINKHWLFLK